MKQFRKEKTEIGSVKFKQGDYTQVKGNVSDGRSSEEFDMKIDDPRDPDFDSARSSLLGHIAEVIDVPKGQRDDLRLEKVKLNNDLAVKATIKRTLEGYDSQVKIVTPHLNDVTIQQVDAFLEEAKAFLLGEKRAQTELELS